MKKDKKHMLPEYGFTRKKGVRGKYAKAMKNGYTIRTYSGKKVTSERFYAPIAPEVLEYFPTSKTINDALRKLIALVPKKAR